MSTEIEHQFEADRWDSVAEKTKNGGIPVYLAGGGGGGGGGDASAANQVIANTHLENLEGLTAQSKTILSKETLTVSGTALALPNVPVDAEGFLIDVYDANIRYFMDGSTPTTSTGHRVAASGVIEERMSSISNIKIIAESGTANLVITYFKYAVNPVVITPINPVSGNVYELTDGIGIALPYLNKSFHAVITGTGAVSATVSIQFSNTNSNYAENFQLPLSGTDSDISANAVQNSFKYCRAVVSDLMGTGAAVAITVGV